MANKMAIDAHPIHRIFNIFDRTAKPCLAKTPSAVVISGFAASKLSFTRLEKTT